MPDPPDVLPVQPVLPPQRPIAHPLQQRRFHRRARHVGIVAARREILALAILDAVERTIARGRQDRGNVTAFVGEARLVVRTGEDTAYSNVVLRCGVPFAV